jgi:hypothetical protein
MTAKTFTGPSRVEVNEEATKWLASRKALKQVGKWAQLFP